MSATPSSESQGRHGLVQDLVFEVAAPTGERQAIVQIERLDIEQGQLTALSGPSGSGKSTLLYLLAGLLQPTRGSVKWAGRDISGSDESVRDRWRLDHAGFVFQGFNLIEELSPLENVLLPARFGGRSISAARVRASALLAELGVPVGRANTALLSRGEQQRVAVARALLRDPKVIFADEPTASLDAETAAEVARLLKDLSAGQGRSVVIATHDQSLLSLADQIVRLDHGRRLDPPAKQVVA